MKNEDVLTTIQAFIQHSLGRETERQRLLEHAGAIDTATNAFPRLVQVIRNVGLVSSRGLDLGRPAATCRYLRFGRLRAAYRSRGGA
jgi:hypothetical protein